MKLSSAVSLIFILFLLGCDQSSPTPKNTSVAEHHIKPFIANADLTFSSGQTVYVPAYSQIQSAYPGEKGSLINMAVTLSIRNTDKEESIVINSVKYYGNDGTLIKDYIETPLKVGPMGSKDFYIERFDLSGGIGANFLVDWGAEKKVYEPYIEAIMIGSIGTLGYSWRSPGQVLDNGE